MLYLLLLLLVIVLISSSNAFSIKNNRLIQTKLYMGRAAAVRANTKGKTDAAKAKNNNIYAKKIIMVVKQGGPDPVSNTALERVLKEAKAANVPNDVVKRNIDKAASADTADFKEATFEYYGHGGVGLIVNVNTDNNNRATNDVNLVAKKNELKSATMGSVTFNFDQKARIDVKNKVLSEDELLEICLENGVDDYMLATECDGSLSSPNEEGDSTIYVEMEDMSALRDALIASELELTTSLMYVPKAGFMDVSDEEFDMNMKAIEAFEALDDVDSVHHNINVTE